MFDESKWKPIYVAYLQAMISEGGLVFKPFDISFYSEKDCKVLVEMGLCIVSHYTFYHAYTITKAGLDCYEELKEIL